MADLIIQPTKKWIRFLYWTATVVFCVAIGIYVNKFQDQQAPAWLLIIPGLLYIFPVRAHLGQRFTKVTLTGDKLHYETGVLSKTTRTIQISKVQDVRVDQTLWQRLVRTGTLSIETAGESSRLIIPDIDDPQSVADALTDASTQTPAKKKGERS